MPKLRFSKNTFYYSLLGTILTGLIIYLKKGIFGGDIFFEKEIFEAIQPYNYMNMFLIIVWGSCIEEILFRGYFFEILRHPFGYVVAFIFSSLLFVLDHGIWWSFNTDLIFVAIDSIIFTMVYIKGGLIASMLVHMAVNYSLLLA